MSYLEGDSLLRDIQKSLGNDEYEYENDDNELENEEEFDQEEEDDQE